MPEGRVIRVGVTGHRVFDDPEAAVRRVRDGLHRILALAGDEERRRPRAARGPLGARGGRRPPRCP